MTALPFAQFHHQPSKRWFTALLINEPHNYVVAAWSGSEGINVDMTLTTSAKAGAVDADPDFVMARFMDAFHSHEGVVQVPRSMITFLRSASGTVTLEPIPMIDHMAIMKSIEEKVSSILKAREERVQLPVLEMVPLEAPAEIEPEPVPVEAPPAPPEHQDQTVRTDLRCSEAEMNYFNALLEGDPLEELKREIEGESVLRDPPVVEAPAEVGHAEDPAGGGEDYSDENIKAFLDEVASFDGLDDPFVPPLDPREVNNCGQAVDDLVDAARRDDDRKFDARWRQALVGRDTPDGDPEIRVPSAEDNLEAAPWEPDPGTWEPDPLPQVADIEADLFRDLEKTMDKTPARSLYSALPRDVSEEDWFVRGSSLMSVRPVELAAMALVMIILAIL